MNILAILLPLALGLGLLGLMAFFWCMRSGQFVDLEGAGWRVLNDDDVDGAEPDPTARIRSRQRTG